MITFDQELFDEGATVLVYTEESERPFIYEQLEHYGVKILIDEFEDFPDLELGWYMIIDGLTRNSHVLLQLALKGH